MALTRQRRFDLSMKMSLSTQHIENQGRAESSARCPAPASSPLQGGYRLRLAHGSSFQNNGFGFPVNEQFNVLNLIDSSGKSSMGRIGPYVESHSARSHSTPEGWVRPQDVGPRAPQHACVSAGGNLKAQKADSMQIQSLAILETE